MFKKRLIIWTLVALTVGSLLLGACDGMARVNVDMDPETGEGTIDITGGGEGDTGGSGDGTDGSGDDTSGDTSGDSGSENQGDMQTAIIFATVVALLLGVTAMVVSLANRPRGQQ